MKPEIRYIENKSAGYDGPAWIGYVEFSKSGQTVYFNNKALKKLKVPGISGTISTSKPVKNTGYQE